MKKWQLPNLLYNENSNYDYSLSYTNEDGNEITLYDSDTFYDKVMYKYTSWCISSPVFFDTVTKTYISTTNTIDQAVTLLHKLYEMWKNDRLPGFIKLYEAMRSKYNPIWNVDGVTGVISEDEHTGNSVNAKSGDDTLSSSGTDRNVSSGSDIRSLGGSDVNSSSGTDSLLRTGTIQNAKNITLDQNVKTGSVNKGTSGNDTVTNSVTTFDDDLNFKNHDKTVTGYGKTETETYNSVTDAHTYSDTDTETRNATDATTYGKSDTTTYGKTDTLQHGKTDAMTYGKTDKTTYASSNTETRNLADKHVEMTIRQGNIGVTKTQELLESQIDLTSRDALIDYMIADFIHSNCII